MCTTRCPGSTCTTSGRPGRDARVYVVHSTPAWANADPNSRTYTFMPPLSPDPGWTSGDVWSERTETLRTEIQNATHSINIPRMRGAGGVQWRAATKLSYTLSNAWRCSEVRSWSAAIASRTPTRG